MTDEVQNETKRKKLRERETRSRQRMAVGGEKKKRKNSTQRGRYGQKVRRKDTMKIAECDERI
jgi:hypothetical protein